MPIALKCVPMHGFARHWDRENMVLNIAWPMRPNRGQVLYRHEDNALIKPDKLDGTVAVSTPRSREPELRRAIYGDNDIWRARFTGAYI